MANTKKSVKKVKNQEPDSVYFLKLVMYFILGCLWIQIGDDGNFALPVGLVIGIVFASHDHFQIDRKIEIAMLFIATVLSLVLPIGFVLNIGN